MYIAGDTAVSTYGVNMWACSHVVCIYSTKEQCRQIRVERACERYMVLLIIHREEVAVKCNKILGVML